MKEEIKYRKYKNNQICCAKNKTNGKKCKFNAVIGDLCMMHFNSQ